MASKGTSKRGFASMSQKEREEIARKGGEARGKEMHEEAMERQNKEDKK